MKKVRLGSLTTAEVVMRYIKPATERHACRYAKLSMYVGR